MQDKSGNVNMTDDEIFDRVISGGNSGFADDFGKIAVEEKLERVLAEVKSLRDQLYTISMASVSDGGTQTYESYNNIMVGELGEIKNVVEALLEVGKNGLSVNIKPMTDKLDEVRKLVDEAKGGAGSKDRITASEIEALKLSIAEQKETQSAMLELLKKVMKKLDEQEKNNVGSSDEIATTVLKSVASEQKEKNGNDNTKEVMAEIESIKQTINAMQGNDNNSDDDLESSIAKLKAELSQMAGIIDGNK